VKQKQKKNTFLRAWGLNTFVDSCRIDKQITAALYHCKITALYHCKNPTQVLKEV